MRINKKTIDTIRTAGRRKGNCWLIAGVTTIILAFLGYVGWHFGEMFIKWAGW